MATDIFDKLAPEWKPADIVSDLKFEEQVKPEETAWDRGKRNLEDLFPAAVRSVGQLAIHARDERTRLNAAKYLIAANIQVRRVAVEELGGPLAETLKKLEAAANGESTD